MNEDVEHLKILAIFHFVVAGLSALISLFPIFHFLLGLSILTGRIFEGNMPPDRGMPFVLIGLIFTLLPALMILLGMAYAICLALAGYYLLKKRNYLFCLVMAAVSCIFVPFGTVLGVFTILVLMRPSVKALFGYPAAPSAGAPPTAVPPPPADPAI